MVVVVGQQLPKYKQGGKEKERNKVEEITEKRENRKKTNNNITTRDSHNYRFNFASISVLVLTQCLVHLTNRTGNYIGWYRRYIVVLNTWTLRHIYTCFFSCLSNFEKNQSVESKPKSKTEPETVHSVSYLTQHTQTYLTYFKPNIDFVTTLPRNVALGEL